MSLVTRAVSLMGGLPPRRVKALSVERGVRVPMTDGVELLADRYAPSDPPGPLPTVLIRTPYGRAAPFTWIAEVFAERGYAVLLQSCRGTFGSGGRYEPLEHEARDGAATLDWLSARADTGAIAMFGVSYAGYVQWAVGGHPALRAHAMQMTASQFRTMFQAGGAFSLETILTWCYIVYHQERPFWQVLRAQMALDRALAGPFRHLPLGTADEAALGRAVPYYRAWLEHPATHEYWARTDHRPRVAEARAPIDLLSGWYDVFLPGTLEDYAALRRAGRRPRLTIGPWSHMSPGAVLAAVRESLGWFDEHLRGQAPADRAPVRLRLMGTRHWLSLDDWPPPARSTRWHLQPGRALAPSEPAGGDPDAFRYDPADPTPSVGGAILSFPHAGPKNQRTLEARADVLSYTTEPLREALNVVGPVAVELYLETSVPHADVFARLCDVDAFGRSVNVCDGLLRLGADDPPAGADGVRVVRLELSPTARRFRRGHRIRLQVSGGAHPRFARNLGTGEPTATGTELRPCDHRVFHDARRPSALILPVYTPPDGRWRLD